MLVANLLADLTTLNLAPAEAAQALVSLRTEKGGDERKAPGTSHPDVERAKELLELHRIFKQDSSGSNPMIGASTIGDKVSKMDLDRARGEVREALSKLRNMGVSGQQASVQTPKPMHQIESTNQMAVMTEPGHNTDEGSEDDELDAWS